MDKPRVLSILKPHVFFDDQRTHLQSPAGNLPMVHVPFGVANSVRSPQEPDVKQDLLPISELSREP